MSANQTISSNIKINLMKEVNVSVEEMCYNIHISGAAKFLRILKFCIIRLSYKTKVSGYNKKLNIYKYLELMLFYNILILFGIYKVSSSALKKIFNILLIMRQNESVCLNNSIHCLNLDSCCVRNLKMRPSGQHMEIGRHVRIQCFHNILSTKLPLSGYFKAVWMYPSLSLISYNPMHATAGGKNKNGI